jgi:hypothetical protein
VLEAQGVDLRPEAGRWETLQAATNRRAGKILFELRRLGGIDKVRREVHPEGVNAPWWRLDDCVRADRRRRLQKTGLVLGGIVGLGLVLYFGLRLLFPVDPKVAAARGHTDIGDQLIQEQADFPGALTEFEQAAELTPDDPEVWLRIGVVQERMGDAAQGDLAPAAEESFARSRALLADDVHFRQMRASVYLAFGMVERADQDLQSALTARPADPLTWYELASVFEMRGEVSDAIDALERADQYANDAGNVELSVTARYRRGMLMQQSAFGVQPEAPITPTP